jgi:hypothetical protein
MVGRVHTLVGKVHARPCGQDCPADSHRRGFQRSNRGRGRPNQWSFMALGRQSPHPGRQSPRAILWARLPRGQPPERLPTFESGARRAQSVVFHGTWSAESTPWPSRPSPAIVTIARVHTLRHYRSVDGGAGHSPCRHEFASRFLPYPPFIRVMGFEYLLISL